MRTLPFLLSALVACSSSAAPKGPIDNTGGGPAAKDDVDGDGKPDMATFAGTTVSVAGKMFTVTPDPESGTPIGAQVVFLGTETIVALPFEQIEDDLRWQVLQFRDGALHDLGVIYLGNEPTVPGDGTVVSNTGNCGQSTTIVYRVGDGKIEKVEHTTGTYEETECSACPYVLQDVDGRLHFAGESLRNLSSADRYGADDLVLIDIAPGQREPRIVLEEVKAETTHLDALQVRFGTARVAPRDASAVHADGQFETISLGERRVFVFDVPAGYAGPAVLRATGYYVPASPGIRTSIVR